MDLPSDLLQAASAPGGGQIALIIGAGCSVEAPTGIPAARKCAEQVHTQLVADGILGDGDCTDPSDLSLVTDAVFAKSGSQNAVVERLRQQFDLKSATPNDGYLVAAAMLCEGAVASVVTLNFDLALSHAISALGVGQSVGIIECPEDLGRQKTMNVYYLHRNVNALDPESWVLRTEALDHEWKHHWEPIIATKVLTAPVVVFAGLGTPVKVLIESTALLRKALAASTKIYQVDPATKEQSTFFEQLAIDSSAYIQRGWCQFMDELSQRVTKQQVSRVNEAIQRKIVEDQLHAEDVADLINRLEAIGLIELGKLRAQWLLHDKPYRQDESSAPGLIADLVLALAMMSRISGAKVVAVENGLVEFYRDGRSIAVYVVASGCGHRGRLAVEADVEHRRMRYRSRPAPPRGVIVAGTSDSWTASFTPPEDVVRGQVSDDIVAGTIALPLVHVAELRADPNRIGQLVP